jgi:plastocyanin
MLAKVGVGRRRRRGALLALVAGAALLAPAAAAQGATVYGGPLPISYANPDVTIQPGEALTFWNLDLTAPHDVTSIAIGSDFQPVFRSETVGFGIEVPVVGVEKLPAGAYDYICSIHSNMDGTVTVSGAPGQGGDKDPPALKVKALDRKAGAAAKAGKLAFKVTVDEPATLRLAARKGKKPVAKAAKKLTTGTTKVKAKLTKAGKKLLRRSGGLKLEYSAAATDSAGNTAKKSGKVKLR